MIVDRIGGIGPGYEPKKTDSVAKSADARRITDNVTISQEAAQAAEMAKVVKLVETTEDPSRAEKLQAVKERLQNGEYDQLSDEVLDQLADRVTSAFLGE